MSYEIKTDKILIRNLFKMWFRVLGYQRPYVFPNSIAVIGTNDKWTMTELQANQDRYLTML